MSSGTIKKLLWALLISTVFIFVLLTRVEWKHFSLIAERVEKNYFLSSLFVFSLGNFIRTLRFLKLDHTGNKLLQWWNINAFYNFITATLPGGTGEAATAYVLKRISKFNMLGALRILLISRLMDLFAISALFLFAAIQISSSTPYREAAIWLSGGLFFLSSIALIPASERFILGLLQKLPRNIPFVQKVCERLNELLEIAKKRRSVGYITVTLVQSILTALGGTVALHMLLQSFGISFTLVQSFYCYGVYAVFQIIPVQGIAGIGTQAAWWALALKAVGYPGSDVVALGFVLHGIFYAFIAVIGLSALPVWAICKKNQIKI